MYYYVFLTDAYTGLRRGELLGLKWSDIDFNEESINVERTLI
ncbi:MAG: tyrosine-type recombinase/integrase [Bacillota bacterium]